MSLVTTPSRSSPAELAAEQSRSASSCRCRRDRQTPRRSARGGRGAVVSGTEQPPGGAGVGLRPALDLRGAGRPGCRPARSGARPRAASRVDVAAAARRTQRGRRRPGRAGSSLSAAASDGLDVVVADDARPASAAASPVAAAIAPSTTGRGRPRVGEPAARRRSGHSAPRQPQQARGPASRDGRRAARRWACARPRRVVHGVERAARRRRRWRATTAVRRLDRGHRAQPGAAGTPGRRPGPGRAASAGSRPADWVCPAAGSRASASSSRSAGWSTALRTSSRAGPAAARSAGAGSTSVAVDGDRERLRVDVDVGQGVVVDHVRLADVPGRRDRGQLAAQAEPVGEPVLERRRRDEGDRDGRRRSASHERRPHQHRLRRRDRRVRVAQRRPRRSPPPLMTTLGPDAEEPRVPEHQVGQLADLDRADLVVDAVRDGGVDRVLRDVAPGPLVVGRQPAAERAAAVPSSRARPARCGVITSPIRPIAWASEEVIESAPRSCRTSSAAIVVARIRDSANARSSGTARVEVVADHQHVEVLGDGVDRVRQRRVGRARDARAAAPAISRMSGACPPPAPSAWKAWISGRRSPRCVDSTKPASLRESECSATWRPALVGRPQRRVDRGRGRAPVLVHLVRRRRRPAPARPARPRSPCCPCPSAAR